MAGGVRNKRTFGRKIKGHDEDIENLYGLINSESNPSAAVSGKAIIAGSSPGVKTSFLPLAGGLMQGPIGHFPSAIAIKEGNLRLNETASGDKQLVRSIVFVSPESGSIDELDTIEGRRFYGQHLTLVAIPGNTITLKHNVTSAENADERGLLLPDSKDFALESYMAVDFFFDDTNNKWRMKGNSGQSSGYAAWKQPCRVATTVNVSLTNCTELIDGVTVIEGDRILLKEQTNAAENGVYVMGVITGGDGPITRAPDMSANGDIEAGTMVYVEEGTTNRDALWTCFTDNPITLGTTGTVWGKIGWSTIPKTVNLSSDILTVVEPYCRFIVSGEGFANDDIKFLNITNPRPDTFYSIQGTLGHSLTFVNQTITTPPDGNHRKIRTSSGGDFTITGNANVLLVYDSIANEFAMLGAEPAGFDPIILNETDKGSISGGHNIDWSASNFHRMVLTGNTTLNFINLPPAGKYEQIVLQIQQDGVGGHGITFNDIFTNGMEPIISSAANAYSVVTFYTYDDGTDRLFGFNTTQVTSFAFALSDEKTLPKTSSTKAIIGFRMPFQMTLTDVRLSLTGAASTGLTVVDVRQNGSSIFTTLVNIEGGQKTSTTSAAPVVISTPVLTDDAEMTVFLTGAGRNGAGLKLYLTGFIG